MPADKRWVEIFTYFKEKDVSHQKLAKLIQYIFCLPGTNAPTNRVFSQMNKIWTANKTQLSVSTLKGIVWQILS